MEVFINGEPRELAAGSNVRTLLEQFKLEQKILVVEVNREIVDRGSYAERVLQPGDRIEIVHFVGGG